MTQPLERQIYLRHIKRLQEQNRLLAEVIASERKLRKQAYSWYLRRLQSKWWSVIDILTMSKNCELFK